MAAFILRWQGVSDGRRGVSLRWPGFDRLMPPYRKQSFSTYLICADPNRPCTMRETGTSLQAGRILVPADEEDRLVELKQLKHLHGGGRSGATAKSPRRFTDLPDLTP